MQFSSTHFGESVWIGPDDDWESVPEKFRSHITEQHKAFLLHPVEQSVANYLA